MEEMGAENDRSVDPSIKNGFSKSEMSSLTPVEEQEMKTEAEVISEVFLALYGKYMPSQTRKKRLEIRVLI